MNNKRNNRYKGRGSILVITALAAIVWIFIAQSLFIVGAGGFGMIKSSRVALQAQQYAEIEVDRLKNVAYENLDSDGAHSRQAIANIQESGWEDEVIIGSEHDISGSDDAKQRIATINVYKSGDTLPRFTLEVPLSSQSSGGGNGLDLDYPRAYNINLCDGYRPHKYVMKQSGVLTGLFLYDYSWGSGSPPNRLYVNNGAVPIPEIHTEDNTGGENSGHRTKTWGYGYAFVSKGDVISFKHNTYYGLQEGCASYNSTISFVPTRKK